MSDAELRDRFVKKVKGTEPFKLVEFNRFANGQFVYLAAEYAFIGYKVGLEDKQANN